MGVCPAFGVEVKVNETFGKSVGDEWREANKQRGANTNHTCRRHYPGGNGPVLASLGSRPLAAIPEPDPVGRSG